MKGLKHKLALVVLILGLGSCTYEDVDVKSIDNFQVENALNKNKPMQLKMDVLVENPNSYPIKIAKADLNLYLGKKDLGKVKLVESVKIPRKSEEKHTLTIQPNDRKIFKKALSGALGALLTGKAKVRVKGKVKGKVFFIGKWFDVDHTENVNLRGLLEAMEGE